MCSTSCIWRASAMPSNRWFTKPSAIRFFVKAPTAACAAWPSMAGSRSPPTAAHRLLDFLYQTYGSFIDAIVSDALYANGPWMTHLDDCGYGGFIVLKKENNEPLKEALALWQGQGPCEIYDDPHTQEHIEFW